MGESGKLETTQTVDEVINKIGKSPNFLLFLVGSCAASCSYVGCFYAYMVVFTGFIPNQKYVCLSQKCLDLKSSYTSKMGELNSSFFDTQTICDNEMVHDVDFKWDLSRTSFAVDYNKICKKSEISLLNSLYFAGGSISLICGTMAFESLGRRKTALIGGFIGVVATLVGAFSSSYSLMCVIRLLQGAGNFLAYAGTYIWVLEYIPEQYRVYYNSWSMMIWTLGYPMLVCVCYYIHNWNYIFIATSLACAVTYIPVIILPDSPRFLMALGKVDEAKRVLTMYSKLARKPINLEGVNLVVEENPTKNDKMSTRARLAEIKQNKSLLLETLLQLYVWFVSCLLFYFLNYGWGSFGDTPHVNYLFAGLGEAIAYILLAPVTAFMGRKKGMIFCLGASCACFLLGLIPWVWSDVWSFERLTNLAAIIWVACAFALVFLYTNELAPTTHRGLVMCSCSVVARAAAFIGPFVSEIFQINTVKLAVNACLAGTAALIVVMLPETKKLPIPEVADDVTSRRKQQGLKMVL